MLSGVFVNQLFYRYGVSRILGIRYGYEGFISKINHSVIELTAPMVSDIHLAGVLFWECLEANRM